MNLVPPTHGRALVQRTVARELLVGNAEKRLRERMLDEMDSLFRREIGATAPREWLSWESIPRDPAYEVDVRLSAEAPTRAREVLTPGGARTFQIPVSTESRIPIVPSPYAYGIDNPFRRDDHVLTFAGWDAETGLMVFDR